MYHYETLFVQHPGSTEVQIRETSERVRRVLETLGAEITDVQNWGLRDLAYPIQKQTKGTYVLFEYHAEPHAVKELERNLKIADEVLRFVSVRLPAKAKPSPKNPRPEIGEGEAEGDAKV
jgi:small subunit ribosomal protein S6